MYETATELFEGLREIHAHCGAITCSDPKLLGCTRESVLRVGQIAQFLTQVLNAHLGARGALASMWQPIETAPKDRAVLIYANQFLVGHFNTALGLWIGSGHQSETQSLNDWSKPTHWMPLPPAPQKERIAVEELTT